LVSDIADMKFQVYDVESLKRHYGRTLEHWAINFENSLPEISKMTYLGLGSLCRES